MKNVAAVNVTTPTDREIVVTRTFDAPRKSVWDSMTKPDLLQRWLTGPPGWSMVSCQDDSRAGGAFRWVWRGPDGNEMAIRGVYHEVTPPERLVRTESFEFGCEAQAGEQIATLVLTERGGRTNLTLTLLYPSKQSRDGAIASGMDRGMSASYDALDELLASNP